MSKLICNLPAEDVWVRKEYLRDGQDGHGEFIKGIWISCKSIPGRAFYFETYLPEYGALFDKLPISAFCSRPKSTVTMTIDRIDSTQSPIDRSWPIRYDRAVSLRRRPT